MEKPDGLVALPLDVLPDALRLLALRDLPGIGARTEKRLSEKGIRFLAAGTVQRQRHGSVGLHLFQHSRDRTVYDHANHGAADHHKLGLHRWLQRTRRPVR